MLSAALTDPFPEAKRECCSLLLRLTAVCPGQLRSRLGKVIKFYSHIMKDPLVCVGFVCPEYSHVRLLHFSGSQNM